MTDPEPEMSAETKVLGLMQALQDALERSKASCSACRGSGLGDLHLRTADGRVPSCPVCEGSGARPVSSLLSKESQP